MFVIAGQTFIQPQFFEGQWNLGCQEPSFLFSFMCNTGVIVAGFIVGNFT